MAKGQGTTCRCREYCDPRCEETVLARGGISDCTPVGPVEDVTAFWFAGVLVIRVKVPSKSIIFEFSWVRIFRRNRAVCDAKSAGDNDLMDSAAEHRATHVEDSGGRLRARAKPSQLSSSSVRRMRLETDR